MGVPNSEVSNTSAMPRREDHEVPKDMWGHWGGGIYIGGTGGGGDAQGSEERGGGGGGGVFIWWGIGGGGRNTCSRIG